MPGELRGSVVLITDEREANRIHNKGYPGVPQSGGGLMLGLLEAAFLMNETEFEVSGVRGLHELFHHGGRIIPDFEVKYLVYRELKLRGFFVKLPDHHFGDGPRSWDAAGSGTAPAPGYALDDAPFRLLPRGSGPSVPAIMHVLPVSEREEFAPDRFHDFARTCRERGVEGLLAVVDEDGDVTFYAVGIRMPEGDCPPFGPSRGGSVTGRAGRNRVLVPLDPEAEHLHRRGFFGQIMGSMLHLSLLEALYLLEQEKLVMEGVSGFDALMSDAATEQSDIRDRYPVYRRLRQNGVRVKTGFKYGTHFRAYATDPDRSHADHLVHVLPYGRGLDWQEISRAIRVAHGVRKRILFACPGAVTGGTGGEGRSPGYADPESTDFLELAWVKP